ncbi:hypothetical protein [Cupriavidus sp. U2]|nr:hypothetical protein [Cupriavidus sp. U2]
MNDGMRGVLWPLEQRQGDVREIHGSDAARGLERIWPGALQALRKP